MILPLHLKEGGNFENTANIKMKCQITAIAPTVYQTQSLSEFRIGCVENANGSFSGKAYFETLKEARKYLKDLAKKYYDNDRKAIAWHLGKDTLKIDGVTACISKSDCLYFLNMK